MKILFFTESLICGGKERRILELIRYLKTHTDYKIALIITEPIIDYDYAYNLEIDIKVIKRKGIKYDPLLFIKFWKYCQKFKPDIIHSWGRMTTFYAIPTKLFLRIPLITNMIADARGNSKKFSFKYFFFCIDILLSNVILSNSKAGLAAYKITSVKAMTIYNGVNLDRFNQNFASDNERQFLGINTPYMVIMVSAFSDLKDYDLFLDVAKEIMKLRKDVTFVGVGDGPKYEHIKQRIKKEHINNVILTGKQHNVEKIIAASDIGLLCTYSEGISNSIIEYMALGKPAISTDLIGGSKELIVEGKTGYCLERNKDKIATKINFLLDNPEIRKTMGAKGKERISSYFSLDRMGKDFLNVYKKYKT